MPKIAGVLILDILVYMVYVQWQTMGYLCHWTVEELR